jgi:hypothetical protein
VKTENPATDMKITQQHCTIVGVVAMMTLADLFQLVALGQDANRTTISASAQAQTPVAFERTLREFLTSAAKDQAVVSLLSKHRLTLEYTIPEAGLHCYIGFDDGKVMSAFGQPPRRSELVFVSNARALDKLLHGEDSPSGMQVSVHLSLFRKLSLKRDLKQIRSALTRVYTAACEKVTAGPTMLAKADTH